MIFSNYRPVSVLPVLSKLIERLVYNRLIHYINENKLLYKYQFGFQTGKSTHMALIVLLHKISEALDRGECVIWVFLDFSKAFDTVDHSILLKKMHKYGIQGLALRWFVDYLYNRKQYVTYNSYKSNYELIKAPFLGHCSFYCILMIYLQCHRPASQFYLQMIPTCL